MLEFVTLFLYFSLVIMFFNNLPDFSAKKFFFYLITFANNLLCLFRSCTQFFFNISHIPLQKNNGPSLRRGRKKKNKRGLVRIASQKLEIFWLNVTRFYKMPNQILKLNSSKVNLDMMSKLVPKETEIIIKPARNGILGIHDISNDSVFFMTTGQTAFRLNSRKRLQATSVC